MQFIVAYSHTPILDRMMSDKRRLDFHTSSLDVCKHRKYCLDRMSARASSNVDALQSSGLMSYCQSIDAGLSSPTHLHDSSVVDARWRSAHRDRVLGKSGDWQYEMEERREGSCTTALGCARYLSAASRDSPFSTTERPSTRVPRDVWEACRAGLCGRAQI